MKVNFAKRIVISDYKPEAQTSSNHNSGKAYEVQREINKRKVDIDREEFKKSRREKEALKEAKLNYSVNPEKGRDEIIKSFLDSDIPNWNISLVVN